MPARTADGAAGDAWTFAAARAERHSLPRYISGAVACGDALSDEHLERLVERGVDELGELGPVLVDELGDASRERRVDRVGHGAESMPPANLGDRTGDRTVSPDPPVPHVLLTQPCGFAAHTSRSMGRAGLAPPCKSGVF